MATIKSFEDLEVWQKSKAIGLQIFELTANGEFKNEWGVRDQLRRSAFSISSNIAEGFEYDNNADFIRYLKYAKGSAGELRSQLTILNEAGIINDEKYNEVKETLVSTSKSISGFIKYLNEHKKQSAI